jgi:uncharacterized membrane protein HdeD (DUF308 family)
MALEYSSGWWVPVMRGVLALIFGILVLFIPALNLTAVLFLLGLYFIADGLLNVWLAAVLGHVKGGSSWPALIGVLDLALVAAFFLWPDLTAPALSMLIAAWAIFTGIGETARAVSFRTGALASDWPLYSAGVLLIVLGVVLLATSATGLYALLKILGVFFITYGLSTAAAGYKERRRSRSQRL